MLPHLAIEVLQEIGGRLPNADQKNLRAVCRELNIAIDPLFYTLFVLRGEKIRQECGLEMLARLAAGNIGVVVSLAMLRGEGMSPKWWPVTMEVPHLLVKALCAMQNIRTVVWTIRTTDPDWIKEAVCDAMNTLPHLSNLQLKMDNYCPLSALAPITQLRKLKIETSHWDSTDPVHKVEVNQLIGRAHGLRSLDLTGHYAWSSAWTMLRATLLRPNPETQIHLRELTAGTISADLLAYLASYSGLQRLTFPLNGVEIPHDGLADKFFGEVLTQHAKSLVELDCPAYQDGMWSFRREVGDAVLQLKNLERLHLSVNSGDIHEDVEPGGEYCYITSDTAALLPKLRLLRISNAQARFYRRANPIVVAIQDFTSHIESRAVVCTKNIVYALPGEKPDPSLYWALAPAISDEGERSSVSVYRRLAADCELVRSVTDEGMRFAPEED
ncbi:F-box domain-containing protein [Favolaschia claudopus]|uniref:F-box domain-containing protein n=1 Tax=Favolaschia claudopus TaxID=2862362 RepID=A0AAW0BE43_9AGAR